MYVSVCVQKVLNFGQLFLDIFCLGFQRFLIFLIHMSHLFFSLSLSLLSRFEDEEREKERENRLSLYRSIAKSAFCVVFFYSRDGAKALNEPIFFFLSASL